MISNMQKFSAAVAVATALSIAASSPALAVTSPAQATVNLVEFNNNGTTSTPQLLIQLNTSPLSNYYANVGSTVCGTAPSIETAKIWAGMAQAAMLSGKKLNVYFSDCGGFHFITQVDLLPF